MPRFSLLFALLISMSACKPDSTILSLSAEDQQELNQFLILSDSNRLKIADDDEAGVRLVLGLTFVDKANKQVLPDQSILFYHTDAAGEYKPTDSQDETTARLCGTAHTDALGRILVETILPGNYGSGENNRHIHTTVFGAKPEAYDIHFKQHTDWMGNNFIEDSDQHFLADLKYGVDSILLALLTLEIKNPTSQ